MKHPVRSFKFLSDGVIINILTPEVLSLLNIGVARRPSHLLVPQTPNAPVVSNPDVRNTLKQMIMARDFIYKSRN